MIAETTQPFAALADPLGDYELTMFLTVDLNRPGDAPSFVQECTVEAGREDRRWRLRVSPVLGHDASGLVIQGPPLVDLRDQIGGQDSLSLLRALLSGRTE